MRTVTRRDRREWVSVAERAGCRAARDLVRRHSAPPGPRPERGKRARWGAARSASYRAGGGAGNAVAAKRTLGPCSPLAAASVPLATTYTLPTTGSRIADGAPATT